MLDEMEYLQKKYNLDGFYIVDDLLMVNKQKITEFCTGIIERGLKIKYNCFSQVIDFDHENNLYLYLKFYIISTPYFIK